MQLEPFVALIALCQVVQLTRTLVADATRSAKKLRWIERKQAYFIDETPDALNAIAKKHADNLHKH